MEKAISNQRIDHHHSKKELWKRLLFDGMYFPTAALWSLDEFTSAFLQKVLQQFRKIPLQTRLLSSYWEQRLPDCHLLKAQDHFYWNENNHRGKIKTRRNLNASNCSFSSKSMLWRTILWTSSNNSSLRNTSCVAWSLTLIRFKM